MWEARSSEHNPGPNLAKITDNRTSTTPAVCESTEGAHHLHSHTQKHRNALDSTHAEGQTHGLYVMRRLVALLTYMSCPSHAFLHAVAGGAPHPIPTPVHPLLCWRDSLSLRRRQWGPAPGCRCWPEPPLPPCHCPRRAATASPARGRPPCACGPCSRACSSRRRPAPGSRGPG